jgi:ADP-ribose pyrophosphatase YjhB (NUDIX family)
MPKHAGTIEILARGLLIRSGRVLLCRNVDRGYFYLPGGHVEFGEPAHAALEREFLEETGRTVRAGVCLLASEHAFRQGKKDRHELNLVFHVEHVEPEAPARKGGRAARARKKGSPAPRSKKAAGGGVFHVEHPDLPRFRSLEKGIAFDWVDLAAIVDLDLRPTALRAWLASGGMVGERPRGSLPPLGWYSDIAPAT